MDQLKPSPPNSSPLTPLSFLQRAATVYANCPSLVYGDTTYTWSDTYLRRLRIASALSSLGIAHHDVVSVVATNIPAMYELHFAIPMAGAILHCVNLHLNAHTVSVVLRHAESKLIFVDYESESLVLEAIALFPPDSPRPRLILVAEGDQSRALKQGFIVGSGKD